MNKVNSVIFLLLIASQLSAGDGPGNGANERKCDHTTETQASLKGEFQVNIRNYILHNICEVDMASKESSDFGPRVWNDYSRTEKQETIQVCRAELTEALDSMLSDIKSTSDLSEEQKRALQKIGVSMNDIESNISKNSQKLSASITGQLFSSRKRVLSLDSKSSDTSSLEGLILAPVKQVVTGSDWEEVVIKQALERADLYNDSVVVERIGRGAIRDFGSLDDYLEHGQPVKYTTLALDTASNKIYFLEYDVKNDKILTFKKHEVVSGKPFSIVSSSLNGKATYNYSHTISCD